MAGRRCYNTKYVPPRFYRLPPIGEKVPLESCSPPLYQSDIDYEDWSLSDHTETPQSSYTDISKRVLPSVVDRLFSENVSTMVRGVEIPNPKETPPGRDGLPGRIATYPAPRFSQIPQKFLGPNSPDTGQAREDSLKDGSSSSHTFGSRWAPELQPHPSMFPGRRRPYYLSPLQRAQNRSLDRLVTNYLGESRNKKPAKDPLICKCCQDVNKINLYHQRLGHATCYPLLATEPRLGEKMASLPWIRKDSSCYFAERRESDQDVLSDKF